MKVLLQRTPNANGGQAPSCTAQISSHTQIPVSSLRLLSPLSRVQNPNQDQRPLGDNYNRRLHDFTPLAQPKPQIKTSSHPTTVLTLLCTSVVGAEVVIINSSSRFDSSRIYTGVHLWEPVLATIGERRGVVQVQDVLLGYGFGKVLVSSQVESGRPHVLHQLR